jgi:Beta-1,4-xylanase
MLKTHRAPRRYIAFICALCLVVSVSLTACAEKVPDVSGTESVPAGTETPTAQATPEPSGGSGDWPVDFSLCEAYEDDFLLGTIYTDASRSGADNELTLKHFNVITPENLMKPENMQPAEGDFNYDEADTMIQFAQENGLQTVGHTLVWHQQSGDWLGRGGREQAIEQLRSHITNVVGKYKGQILSWDVVNEAIADEMSLPADGDWTKCLRKTQWYTAIGPEYIRMAFEFAREADPDAKLYYNDYNLDVKSKADAVYAMVRDLRSQGVPIDGIGEQGHYTTDTSAKSVQYALDLFSELGVEVSITELDVSVNNVDASGLTEEQEIQQGVVYAQLFSLFREYRDLIARVTFWGYVDNKSWRGDRFPCLFNADFSPKQAAYAVLDPDKFLELHRDALPSAARMAVAKYGTPVIDGEIDDIWADCPKAQVNIPIMAWEGAKGEVSLLWDESFVYVLFTVQDELLNNKASNAYEQDSIEIFLDQNNDKATSYGPDDGQYRVSFVGDESFGTVPVTPGFSSAAKLIDGGYLVELAIPLLAAPEDGMIMGFDAQVNDSDAQGIRQSMMKFNDPTNSSYLSPEKWGLLQLSS